MRDLQPPSPEQATRTAPPNRPQRETPTEDDRPAAAGELILAPGCRPLPEYRLIARRGRGGFGEVWQAEGPGGFEIALKFISLQTPLAETELHALDVMKSVRHPHLMATFASWLTGGYLVVGMELADLSLQDRLRGCIADGLPGIPLEELLGYLAEAAKGLDYLNQPAVGGRPGARGGIQHKDVKPANLLLVGGSVKVADFGLVAVLERTVATVGGGLTPVYAAPEFFNGRATRWSDQYSLAVVYCALRGRRLPFEGSAGEVMAGHMLRPPNLDMLPEAERPAVARALSKEPTERWRDCRTFVESIARAACC
jgi:serine/threonine protein kinase